MIEKMCFYFIYGSFLHSQKSMTPTLFIIMTIVKSLQKLLEGNFSKWMMCASWVDCLVVFLFNAKLFDWELEKPGCVQGSRYLEYVDMGKVKCVMFNSWWPETNNGKFHYRWGKGLCVVIIVKVKSKKWLAIIGLRWRLI